MHRSRSTIARLLLAIAYLALVFAGIRSGSNDLFKLNYTLTFVVLIYGAIAARYRGPFWHGFAVAGWAYFIVAFGPWIVAPGAQPLRVVNRNIGTSVILEIVSGMMYGQDRAALGPITPASSMMLDMYWANRDGVCHSALTMLFACVGGLVSRRVARRASAEAQ